MQAFVHTSQAKGQQMAPLDLTADYKAHCVRGGIIYKLSDIDRSVKDWPDLPIAPSSVERIAAWSELNLDNIRLFSNNVAANGAIRLASADELRSLVVIGRERNIDGATVMVLAYVSIQDSKDGPVGWRLVLVATNILPSMSVSKAARAILDFEHSNVLMVVSRYGETVFTIPAR